MLSSVAVAMNVGTPDVARGNWIFLLLIYAFTASVLPVWLLCSPGIT